MIKDLGNGKKSKAIAYTSQLFTTTIPIPSLSNGYMVLVRIPCSSNNNSPSSANPTRSCVFTG